MVKVISGIFDRLIMNILIKITISLAFCIFFAGISSCSPPHKEPLHQEPLYQEPLHQEPVHQEYEDTELDWLYRGTDYYDEGKYEDAIESYKHAIEIKPDYEEAYYGLGGAYFKLKMYQEAIEAFKQVIKFNPDLLAAHYGLGLAYFQSGLYREAIQANKQAIQINPDDAETHLALGVIYILLNDKDSALKEYEILKDLDPQMANELIEKIDKL
jgi:tetratricopeptide (TPR) repeat protein